MKKLILILLSSISFAHATDLPEIPAPVAPEIFHAEQAAKVTIDYQADANPQIIYFGVHGEKADSAVKGGYYRKVLGKTADGRAVVQNFYQDNDQAQSSPAILIKDADVNDFDAGTLDSRIVWYRPDGSVFSIDNFKNGKQQGLTSYYLNGTLVIQQPENGYVLPKQPTTADGKLGRRIFSASGKTVLSNYTKSEDLHIITLFREDGSPIFKSLVPLQEGEDPQILGIWNEKGEAVELDAVEEDFYKNSHYYQKIIRQLIEDYDVVFHTSPEENPFMN